MLSDGFEREWVQAHKLQDWKVKVDRPANQTFTVAHNLCIFMLSFDRLKFLHFLYYRTHEPSSSWLEGQPYFISGEMFIFMCDLVLLFKWSFLFHVNLNSIDSLSHMIDGDKLVIIASDLIYNTIATRLM